MHCKHYYIAISLLLALSLLLYAPDTGAQLTSSNGKVWQINVDGVIGPATSSYMISNLEKAQQNNVELLLVHLNTPGGLDTSMREMIQAILSSSIPVVIYVSPSGSRAASAGTYLLYASHVAAMAPATNLGAATPVQIGGPGLPEMPGQPGDGQQQGDEQQQQSPQPANAMERKLVNDAVAYIKSLAELRGRNVEWAEQAVREGASLSAQEALQNNVIDIVADNQNQLLQQLHQRQVVIGGETIRLNTQNISVTSIEPDWRNRLLEIITNPNVAYILLLVGIYGLIFEFSNPGLGAPGLIGAVSLMMALYALHVLPVSFIGIGLLVLGIVLMVFEVFSPTFGISGISGVAVFIVGSILLMDSDIPAYQIALPIILAMATVSAGLILIALSMVVRSTRQPVVSGVDVLIGRETQVENIHKGVPIVMLAGELWSAQCKQELKPGDRVVVESVNNLTVKVKKIT